MSAFFLSRVFHRMRTFPLTQLGNNASEAIGLLTKFDQFVMEKEMQLTRSMSCCNFKRLLITGTEKQERFSNQTKGASGLRPVAGL